MDQKLYEAPSGVINMDARGAGHLWRIIDGSLLIDQDLTVTRDVTIDGNIVIGGTIVFTGSLSIISTTTPQLTVGHDLSNYFTISVSSSGVVAFDAVGASAFFTFADGIQVFSGGATITGNVLINGPLSGLTGFTTVSGGATINGNTTINGTLGGLTGLTVVSGGAAITGNSTITGTLTGLTGLTVASGGITVTSGGINVTGNSTITGTLGGLTGLTVASGGITVTGNSTITGTLGGLTGLTVASGGINVTGNSTINGTLGGLTGLTVVSGGISIAGGVTITSGGITVTGNSTINGTLGGLTGLTVVSGGITVTGNSTITGTLGGLSGLTVASGGAVINGNSYVVGDFGVGAQANTAVGLHIQGTITTGTNSQFGVSSDVTVTTGTSGLESVGLFSRINIPSTAGTAFLITKSLYAADATKAGTSTITTNYGLWVADMLAGVTNYAIFTNAGLVSIGGATTIRAGGIAVTGNSTITGTLGGLTGLTVASGGITVTGNSTITGTLGGLTGLTVASGGITVTGNSTITGTLGSLTGLTVASGGITVTGNSTITGTLGSLTGLTVASGGITVTGNSTISGTLGSLTGLTLTSGNINQANGAGHFFLDTAATNIQVLAAASDNTVRIGFQSAATNNGHLLFYANGTEQGRFAPGGPFTSSNGVTVSAGGATITGISSITSTTANQLTVAYDTSNKNVINISSAGAVTYTASGASAGHSFANAVTVTTGGVNVTGASTFSTTVTLTAGNVVLANGQSFVVKDTGGTGRALLTGDGSNTCLVGYVVAPTSNGHLIFYANGAEVGRFAPGGPLTVSAGGISNTGGDYLCKASVATSATSGFTYIPGGAGIPSGTPTNATATQLPFYYDTTDHRLYFYEASAWHYIARTA